MSKYKIRRALQLYRSKTIMRPDGRRFRRRCVHLHVLDARARAFGFAADEMKWNCCGSGWSRIPFGERVVGKQRRDRQTQKKDDGLMEWRIRGLLLLPFSPFSFHFLADRYKCVLFCEGGGGEGKEKEEEEEVRGERGLGVPAVSHSVHTRATRQQSG